MKVSGVFLLEKDERKDLVCFIEWSAQAANVRAVVGSGSGRVPTGTFREQDPHPQVAAGQPNDGGLVQLRGDGGRQRQHLGQLIKLAVLLLPPRPGGVLGLLLHPVPSSLARSHRHLRAAMDPGVSRWSGRDHSWMSAASEPPCWS